MHTTNDYRRTILTYCSRAKDTFIDLSNLGRSSREKNIINEPLTDISACKEDLEKIFIFYTFKIFSFFMFNIIFIFQTLFKVFAFIVTYCLKMYVRLMSKCYSTFTVEKNILRINKKNIYILKY